MERIKIKPLTEEQKSEVRAYFENKTIEQLKDDKDHQKIRFNYGRMRNSGFKIDIAEKYCQMVKEERSTQYRFMKENEIKSNSKEYEMRKGGGYDYEVVNLSFYKDGRVLEIGIYEGTKEDGKTKRSQTTTIEERLNPVYFKELLKRYKLED